MALPKVSRGNPVHIVDPDTGVPLADTIGWTVPALVTTNAASATDILAAGVALSCLIIVNEHATEACRIRFDGSDATSVRGINLAAGKGITFSRGNVPSGKISGYSTNASTIFVAYC